VSVPTDAELARDALAGSEAAYRELVARYASPAVNFIYRIVRDRALAEDLAQEGFLRVYQRLDTYDPARKFSSWFFQVLRNITIDHLRVHRLPTASLDALADEGHQAAGVDRASASPEELTGQRELASMMSAALHRLRPEYRQVVVLRYQEGLTHPEIAEILGVPSGTVKTYLHRARKELAGILAEQGLGPPVAPARGPDETVRSEVP
jgi:RNA polymerase sigma-70 factor (ECF subfamily)